MTEHLSPDSLNPPETDEEAILRARSRSPHPYHHQNTDLPHLSDRFTLRNRQAQSAKSSDDASHEPSPSTWPPFLKDSPQTSDSGSEADDEHYLKGLPAPKTNLHKGLRGLNEPLSGSSTPLPSPAILDGHTIRTIEKPPMPTETPETQRLLEVLKRRRRVVVRRVTEAGTVLALGLMVASNSQVLHLLKIWGKGMHINRGGIAFANIPRHPDTWHSICWATRFVSHPGHRLGLPQSVTISPNTT
ncbi:hypothetical protein ACHAPI_005484 [Fusarium lateritium]